MAPQLGNHLLAAPLLPADLSAPTSLACPTTIETEVTENFRQFFQANKAVLDNQLLAPSRNDHSNYNPYSAVEGAPPVANFQALGVRYHP